MEEALISVIVPIYKVEPYLPKCVESILGQTYQNLEVILVDDGSPDGCGALCDKYAAEDSRVKVIHKENGGVSSARNAGLRVASGRWIGWVDPDDWIEPDMYEYLLQNALKHKADIAVCSRILHYPTETLSYGWEEEELLTTGQALEQLVRKEESPMQNYMCDKLWRAALFDGIEFPNGRTFEDMAVAHRLFERAGRILCLPERKYNYLRRAESIVSDKSLVNTVNYYLAAKGQLEELSHRWPQLVRPMEARCMVTVISAWCCCLACPRATRRRLRPTLLEMADFARTRQKSAREYLRLGAIGRAALRLTPYPSKWAFILARLCNWVYLQKHGMPL